ncbi:MAG: response regulator [Acidobacteriia bacterium]|nr:response regulator [Terriglobia bacterium]
MLNLLGNAIKFTDAGRVDLEASSWQASSETVFRIAVKDTGIGIEAEKLPRLFTQFTQLDSSLVRRHEGTGLGLAISRQLAALMGGALTVTSEWGKGSEFVLTLSSECAAAPAGPSAKRREVPERPAPAAPDPVSKRTRRVLLAEDNAVNQKLGVRLLEKYGCRVDVAANGRKAVAMALGFPYNLILMDCSMPEMDGFEATGRIRAGQQGRRIPIVALTAHAIAGTREECLHRGMDDYVAKPVRVSDIERVLRIWCP